MNHQLQSWQSTGLTILRIITGMLILYHGLEVFDAAKMAEYGKWEKLSATPSPLLLVYIGKSLEFITGLCLCSAFSPESLLY